MGNLWATLLEASGGLLELDKCFFYLLSWTWDTRGNPIPESMINQRQLLHSEGIDLNDSQGLI
jgi:hypothetical protein